MTAAGKGHDMICQKAVSLIVDLCTQDSPQLDHNTCEEFLFLISNQEYNQKNSGKSKALQPTIGIHGRAVGALNATACYQTITVNH
ncbi:hypothetical protein QQF64_021023 [Cirrhinus molitorella]|uniref:Uncharacterized protein n=1 Tax=Cirrhinus molitorella TaxID=172907 RepID=A0ABR3LAZ7_9TELE